MIIDSDAFEIIMYALYFEKDQYLPWTPIELPGSHIHDWEYASVWLTNGVKVMPAIVLTVEMGKVNPPILDKYSYSEIEKYRPISYPEKSAWER